MSVDFSNQPFPKLDSQFVDPQTGDLAIPWYRLLIWMYGELGGGSLRPRDVPLLLSAAPAHTTSAGLPGQIAFDAGFFYFCIGVNSWKRVGWGGGF